MRHHLLTLGDRTRHVAMVYGALGTLVRVGASVLLLPVMLERLSSSELGAFLTCQANVIACSHFLGDDITASFGLTSQVGWFVTNFSALCLEVKWPEITIPRSQGRPHEMGVLFARRLARVMGTFLVDAVLAVDRQAIRSRGDPGTPMTQASSLCYSYRGRRSSRPARGHAMPIASVRI